MDIFARPEFESAAEFIRKRANITPRVGIVLGSGLGDFADKVDTAATIPYNEIPNWPLSTVEGHQGKLYLGTLDGQAVMVMQGRAHSYEGYPMSQVTLPIRVMQLLGVEIVILTNAAGGLNRAFKVGDVMLLTDHINLIGMTGGSPLRGPNDNTLGPRFPAMSHAYDLDLRNLASEAATEANVSLHEGIYFCLSGPSFETPAEIRFLRLIGADAVGMSTAPEATVARHGGMRVLGFSGISNVYGDQGGPESEAGTPHQEVMDAGKVIVPRLEAVLHGVLRKLSG